MKGPDKIYIHRKDLSYSEIKESDSDFEFIRKEALLEKLEKVAASYKKRSDDGELVWQNMCGINEAINILNTM